MPEEFSHLFICEEAIVAAKAAGEDGDINAGCSIGAEGEGGGEETCGVIDLFRLEEV